MIIRYLTRAAAASAAAVGLGLSVLAAPAGAVPVIVDDDYEVFIIGTNVSFGSVVIDPGPFMTGDAQPGGFGRLIWWSDGGVIQPHLLGWMWAQDIGGGCARMRMQYFDANDVLLATRGSSPTEACPSDDDFEIYPIDMAPFADPAITRVVVSTATKSGNGNFVINDSQTFHLN